MNTKSHRKAQIICKLRAEMYTAPISEAKIIKALEGVVCSVSLTAIALELLRDGHFDDYTLFPDRGE